MTKPEYRRVVDEIARRIDVGELEPDEQLPSYRALAAMYDVSISTVRTALMILEDRGLVVGRPGKGTFVAARGGGL
jgi:GntR family transcriptional regulator